MEKNRPVAVVLAGGLGTRLRPLTLRTPKPLLHVAGKPFLSHLLSKIASMGIEECILLTGYKHAMVRQYCKSGKKWGLKITYSREGRPLGTGGALYLARKKISSTALVLNGDSWLDIDLPAFLAFHRKARAEATVFVMKGSLSARGAVKMAPGGQVSEFAEKQKGGTGYFNTGAYLLEPSALSFLSSQVAARRLPRKFSMERDGFPLLVSRKTMFAFRGRGKFLDIGTFASLLSAHKVVSPSPGTKGAIFLDRDGVINRHRHDYVRHPSEFEFEFGAMEGMRALAATNLPIFIVTNQSMIGRGVATKKQLAAVHAKMLSAFRRHKVKIADVLVCPHSPQDGCGCRKPKIGMLLSAQEKHGLDLSKSFVAGDSTSDVLMGKTAGCATILVKTGHAGKDGLHKAKPDFTCRNLAEAAKKIAWLAAKGRQFGREEDG